MVRCYISLKHLLFTRPSWSCFC